MAKSPKGTSTSTSTKGTSTSDPTTPAPAEKESTMTTTTPAAPAATPAPADPPKVDHRAAFLTTYEPMLSADTPLDEAALAPLLTSYRGMAPVTRSTVKSDLAMPAAKSGRIDRWAAIFDAVELAVAAAKVRAKSAPAIDPNEQAADRIAALFLATAALPTVEGADPLAIVGRLSTILTPALAAALVDTLALVTPADMTSDAAKAYVGILDRSAAAVAAVTRGPKGTKAAVTRDPKRIGGMALFLTHKGTKHEAAVAPDGQKVTVNGATFDSLTAAARSVNGDVAVNGWEAWSTADGRTADAVARV